MAMEAAGMDTLLVQQAGEFEFTAYGEDDIQTYKVRSVTADCGEKLEVRLYPNWQNQKMAITLAFGGQMIPDESQPQEDGVIFVKAVDGTLQTRCLIGSWTTQLGQTRKSTI
jgi:hypothetical protein